MPSVKKDEEDGRNSVSSVLTLDLSGRGIKRIEPLPDGMSPQTILYNNNNISRIENLQFFAHLQQLSLASNHLVEMTGISQAQGLTVLDLSNNSIITIEGLTHLRSLEWLNLSGNSIKRIQNLEKNINLRHLDLSDNSIIQISNLRNLTKLKVLLLHGNLISSLKNVSDNVAQSSVVTLSLAENEISDLNELYYLRPLTSLEQLSIAGNPCLLALSASSFGVHSGFNCRPYILYNCPRLHNLDGHLISHTDRLEADRLRRDGKMRSFSPGRHSQLVTYLSQTTPLRPSSARAPPTPNMDRISSRPSSMLEDNQKWSVPVLEDKHSNEARDLALEDVSELDDQLVSESCYVPVDTQPDYDIRGSEDWYMTEVSRKSHYSNHEDERPPSKGHVGVPVERDPNMETERVGGQLQHLEDEVRDECQASDSEPPPIMTEEEAFGLINLAASIIQAHVRGFLVRRKMNFYEYRRKNRAAALIQATWKGYKARTYDMKVVRVRNEIRTRRLTSHINHLATKVLRCQEQAAKDKRTMAKAIKGLWDELEKQNDRNVARLAREQHAAATTIQRSWKGYRARKMYSVSTASSMRSFQSLALVCQNLQKQVNLMKVEIERLKSEKGRRVGIVAQPKPQLDRVKSTPEIRITRPSICILPELQLDNNQPIKSEKSVEELLSDEDADVEVEPLDLGKYDNATSICDTTFEVENTESESKETESRGSESGKGEFESNKDDGSGEDVDDETPSSIEDQIPEKTPEEEEMQANTRVPFEEQQEEESGVSERIISDQENVVKNEEVVKGHETECVEESDAGSEREQKQESYSTDMVNNAVVPETNEKISSQDLTSNFIDKDEGSVNTDLDFQQGHTSKVVPGDKEEKDASIESENGKKEGRETETTNEDKQVRNNSGKSDEHLQTDKNDGSMPKDGKIEVSESETKFTSPQADQKDPDPSDTSPSPSSKPEGIIGRKKKKLLLRSTSADTMPRIRALHSSTSLDSEQLSSSLNFSSRLGQRTAALLLELRSEIASLTARQLSDDYFDSQETESAKTTSTEPSTLEADSADPAADTIKDDVMNSKSDTVISDTKANEAKSLRSSDSGISCQDLGSKDSDIAIKGSTADNDMRTDATETSEVGGTTRRDTLANDSGKFRDNECSVSPGQVGVQGENEHRDTENQSNGSNADKPSTRPASFTMPVFEDIEKTSFSIDDFMEDSLEHGGDD